MRFLILLLFTLGSTFGLLDLTSKLDSSSNFLKSRRPWNGHETTSGILGLASADFQPDHRMLALDKLKLAFALSLFEAGRLENIDDSAMAQFVNAFIYSCVDLNDPYAIFGHWSPPLDILGDLERRLEKSALEDSPSTPGLLLTLCNAGVKVKNPSRIFPKLSVRSCDFLCAEKAALNILALECVRRKQHLGLPERVLNNLFRRTWVNINFLRSLRAKPGYKDSFFASSLLLQADLESNDFNLSDEESSRLYSRLLSFQKSDGSFGESVSLTTFAIPALSNYTVMDISQDTCPSSEPRWAVNSGKTNLFYKIEDNFANSMTWVGDFATNRGISVLSAMNGLKEYSKGVLEFKIESTAFGDTLKALLGIENFESANWFVYRVENGQEVLVEALEDVKLNQPLEKIIFRFQNV